MERVIAGPERKGRIMDDKTKRTIAYHESGHALVGHLLPGADPVHKISIISRGRALGYTLSIPKEDKVLNGRKEMLDDLAVFLGGRVAEEIFCDDITTGASNDLERATKMARAMVTQYGMSAEMGTQIFGQPNHEVFLGRDYGNTQDYSEETAKRIDAEVSRIMKEAHDRAYQILSERREQMDLMASVLLERETVEGEACKALLDNRWNEYLAHEQSDEGRKERDEAANTIAEGYVPPAVEEPAPQNGNAAGGGFGAQVERAFENEEDASFGFFGRGRHAAPGDMQQPQPPQGWQQPGSQAPQQPQQPGQPQQPSADGSQHDGSEQK